MDETNDNIYILTFITYGSGVFQIDPEAFKKESDTKREKEILESCGHTNIKIIKLKLTSKK